MERLFPYILSKLYIGRARVAYIRSKDGEVHFAQRKLNGYCYICLSYSGIDASFMFGKTTLKNKWSKELGI